MKKIIGLSITALALVALAASFLVLGAPDELTAEERCRCPQYVAETSIQQADCQWCTCQDATNILLNQLRAEAGCSDGTCFEDLVITMPCTPHPNPDEGWWVGGKLRYTCTLCIECPSY